MTHLYISTFDEWKKKCCDSSLSKDALVPVLSSSFNVISAVFEDSDRILIQRALVSLDRGRSQSLALEKITEPSLRSLIYGHFKCLHMTLVHLVDEKNQSRSSEFLSAIDEWKKKCCDSNLPDDVLIPVLSRSLDVMAVILKDSHHALIQKSLVSLGFERSQSLNMEDMKESSLRSLIYGLFECIYMAFDYMFEQRNQSKNSDEGWKQPDEIPSQINQNSLVPPYNSSNLIAIHSLDHLPYMLVPKEEEIDLSISIEKPSLGFVGKEVVIKDEGYWNDDLNSRFYGSENADVDNSFNESDSDVMPDLEFMGNFDELFEEISEECEERIENKEKKNYSETGETKKRRRSNNKKRALKSLKYNKSMEDSDENYDPTVEKSKSKNFKDALEEERKKQAIYDSTDASEVPIPVEMLGMLSRRVTKPQRYYENSDDSEDEEKPSVKKSNFDYEKKETYHRLFSNSNEN